VAVFELGMNHPGEIAALAAIAQPTVGLVNNAQREHQEFMATVDAVARENGAVISALPEIGVAVYPADDAQAPVWRDMAGLRAQVTFSAGDAAAAVSATCHWTPSPTGGHWDLSLRTPAGPAHAMLAMAGAHNVHNALAATAAALAAGAPLTAVAAGLQGFKPVSGRSQLGVWHRDGRAVTLVDDSYNANPDSVRAAIDLLASLPGPHWLVLGDMGEVGDQGPAFHAEVGAHALDRGIEALWTVGPLCAETAAVCGARARHFDRVETLLATLGQAPACGSVLIKGSRFMRMERVVAALSATDSSKGGHAH
jgi:UDP-N-acetylmuramoyl-tripeptide--D-alanyl-D-alanine ligase